MRDVYIASAVRSAIGKFGGAFVNHTPAQLAAPVMEAAVERAGLGKDALDFCVFGNVLRGGHGQLVPRQALFAAGFPDTLDAQAVDMVCSSGMAAIMNGANFIRTGDAETVLVGGVESMSGAGFALSSKARWGYKYLPGPMEPVQDLLFRDGLSDPFDNVAMGDQTELLAEAEGVTREELDEVALMSNRRAAEAQQSGAFADEIVGVDYRERRDTKTLTEDEGVRADTTPESLAKLRPAFKPDGVLTAANSSQISDGAAALVLASKEAVEKYGLTPIAKLGSAAWAAGAPWRFPEAPLPALKKVLEREGKGLGDYDLVENNEAFAINSVLMHRKLGVPYEKLNVHGGAISLGHPIGCSGARIVVTLLHALKTRGGARGLASICHGTGGGTALAVEMV